MIFYSNYNTIRKKMDLIKECIHIVGEITQYDVLLRTIIIELDNVWYDEELYINILRLHNRLIPLLLKQIKLNPSFNIREELTSKFLLSLYPFVDVRHVQSILVPSAIRESESDAYFDLQSGLEMVERFILLRPHIERGTLNDATVALQKRLIQLPFLIDLVDEQLKKKKLE